MPRARSTLLSVAAAGRWRPLTGPCGSSESAGLGVRGKSSWMRSMSGRLLFMDSCSCGVQSGAARRGLESASTPRP